MESVAELNNPYLQSRALWNDLYGDIQSKLEKAYRLIVVLSSVIVVVAVGLVWVAMQHQVKPYLTVLHGNQVLTLHEAASSEFQSLKPKLAEIFSKQFIQEARSHSVDAAINTQRQIQAYAHASGTAVSWLKAQWRAEVVEVIRQVQVQSVLIKTDRTISLRWSEETLDPKSGESLHRDYFTAELLYAFQAPSNDSELAGRNPLGFYVTQIIVGKEQV